MAIDQKEKEAIESLFPYLPVNPVLFDVGSNKGHWADVLMHERWEYQIHLFEPNDFLLNYTRVKYEYNEMVRFCDKLVWSSDGDEVVFRYFENKHSELSSAYYNREWAKLDGFKEKLKDTITIDTYCKQNNIHFIHWLKIDVEGAELEVLKGAKEMLANKSVGIIQFEHHSGNYANSGITIDEVVNYLSKFGYKTYRWEYEFISVKDTELADHEDLFSSTEYLEKYTQFWNNDFKEITADLPKMDFFLEIGCFEGLTTNYICDNLMNEGGRIVCVDPLADQYLVDNIDDDAKKMNESFPFFIKQYDRFIRNTKGKPVELIRKTSREAYPELKDYRFDLVYIDGDHRKEAVYNDGVECFKITKDNGYIIFDDYGWKDYTKEGIDMFLNEFKDYIRILKKDYQVLIQKIQDP